MENYLISEKQLEIIEHTKFMIDVNSNKLQEMYNLFEFEDLDEVIRDLNYSFVLLMELEEEIKKE